MRQWLQNTTWIAKYVKISNYDTTKFFTENLLAIEMKKKQKKKQIIMNKPVYLELSMLELSKILIYEFWYRYVKPKYGEKAKLWNMDTDPYA